MYLNKTTNTDRELEEQKMMINLSDLSKIKHAKDKWTNIMNKGELLKPEDQMEDYIDEGKALLKQAEEQLKRVSQRLTPKEPVKIKFNLRPLNTLVHGYQMNNIQHKQF